MYITILGIVLALTVVIFQTVACASFVVVGTCWSFRHTVVGFMEFFYSYQQIQLQQTMMMCVRVYVMFSSYTGLRYRINIK